MDNITIMAVDDLRRDINRLTVEVYELKQIVKILIKDLAYRGVTPEDVEYLTQVEPTLPDHQRVS